MPNDTMASREMAAEIGSKRKHSDAAEAARDGHDEGESIDAVVQPALTLAQSAPCKKPREEPLLATSQCPSLPDGLQPLEEEKTMGNGQDGREEDEEEDEDEDEDPAWILMRALEREIEQSTSNTAASASFPVATAIPEDDDYDESDDDN